MRRGRRWIAMLISVLPLLASACGSAKAHADAGHVLCDPRSGGVERALVLVAQAVPSASELPCIGDPPVGWTFATFEARSGQAKLTFNSDRAGLGALTVTLTPPCQAAGTPAPSDEPKADLWIKIDSTDPLRGTRTYSFEGGCVIERFKFPVVGGTALVADAAILINLTSRAALAARLARDGFHL